MQSGESMEVASTVLESIASLCLSSCFLRKTVEFKSIGKVVVGKVLGEGAFSFVYTVLAPYRGKKYALKKIYLNSAEYDRIVKAELFSFKEFKHRSILELLDHTYVHERNGRAICMLFPLVQQGSLRQVLDQRLSSSFLSPAPLLQVLQHFVSICSALEVMHSHSPQYVHQDIKPENVLIKGNGEPLLTDFGSVRMAVKAINTRAQALETIDEAASLCTVSYRAPELFDPPLSSTIDTRTDVWAEGCLLFAWWYCYSPFECVFTESGRPKVVECSHSRVLNKIPVHPKPRHEDIIVHDICSWVLEVDMALRPFNRDVIARVETSISALQVGSLNIV